MINKFSVFFGLNIFILIFFTLTILSYSQSKDYDEKYTAEYVLKDIRGNEINRLMLYRNGSKLKFVKVNNKGKADETVISIYIFKDDNKIITVNSSSKIKLGFKHTVDMMYIGMETGIYIFDLGNDGSIFNSNMRAGSGTVLGKDCIIYNIITSADGRTDYYMYQNNLMLKRFAGTSTDGSTIEALSYDTTIDIPESTFTVPTDVQFIDN